MPSVIVAFTCVYLHVLRVSSLGLGERVGLQKANKALLRRQRDRVSLQRIGRNQSLHGLPESAGELQQQTQSSRHESPKPRVLIFGSSVDRFAVDDYCKDKSGSLITFPIFPTPLNEPRCCSSLEANIAYFFHPGAGDPPYFNAFGGGLTTTNAGRFCPTCQKGSNSSVLTYHETTQQIVEVDAPRFTNLLWGAPPSAVVVETSLWDLAKFWQRRQFLADEVPHTEIQRWCVTDVPQLLQTVRRTFPHSKIAFRTAPTTRGGGYGQFPEALEAMAKCILDHYDGAKLHGLYDLIDYHTMVDDLIRKRNRSDVFRLDGKHPGPEAGLMYMSEVVRYARDSKESGTIGRGLLGSSKAQREKKMGVMKWNGRYWIASAFHDINTKTEELAKAQHTQKGSQVQTQP